MGEFLSRECTTNRYNTQRHTILYFCYDNTIYDHVKPRTKGTFWYRMYCIGVMCETDSIPVQISMR